MTKPWILYKRTLGSLRVVSRFKHKERAYARAKEEGNVFVAFIPDLSADMLKALGLEKLGFQS